VLGHLARETLTADEILAGAPISASYASQLAVARRVGAFELTVSRGWHKEGRIVVNTEFAEAMARTLSRSRIVLPRSLGRVRLDARQGRRGDGRHEADFIDPSPWSISGDLLIDIVTIFVIVVSSSL
jgi:hypothetical protein